MTIPIKKLLSELSPFARRQCYLLVSYDYLCFFEVSKAGRIRVLKDCRAEYDDISNIRGLFKALREDQKYYGQEIIALLAEPISFNLIRSTKNSDLDDLRKESKSLFGTNMGINYQSYMIASGTFHIAFGYNEDYVFKIREVLQGENVPVLHYMPLFGFILSEYKVLGGNIHAWVIGRTGIIAGTSGDGEFVYCEYIDELPDGYKSLIEDKLNKTISPDSSSVLSKRQLIDNSSDDFILNRLSSRAVNRVTTMIGSCRLLLVLAVLIAITLGSIAIIIHINRSNSSALYTEYEDTLVEIGTLEERLRSVNAELSSFDDDMAQSLQMSPGMSAFCQKIPKGIVVKEIYAEKVNAQWVNYQASGDAEKERAVFSYRDYINKYFSYDCVNIQSIRKHEDPRVNNGVPVYNFIMIGDYK